MWRLSVCFLTVLAASAVYSRGFYYTKPMSMFRRHSEEECRVCFGLDCLPLEEPRCQYYMATSQLQGDQDDEEISPNYELQSKIDTMIYDFIDVSTQEYETMSCIPMLSTYTNCHKENQCTGCMTCTCEEGRWVCTVEECHAESLDFRRQMTVAVASLKAVVAENLSRKKRSTNNSKVNTTESDVDAKITFEELSQWLNDTNLHVGDKMKDLVTFRTEVHSIKKTTLNPDYLAFDEVLSNIALDNNNISRKKAILETVESDYVSFVDIVNSTHEHPNNYFENVEYDPMLSGDEDSFKVDLLKGLKDKIDNQLRMENSSGIYNSNGENFENNYLDDSVAHTLVKRNVLIMNETKLFHKDETIDTNTRTVKDFKNNVLYPLLAIITEKENELKQLSSIKNSLIELVKRMDSNFTLDPGMLNDTDKNKTLFSIYKLEIVPAIPTISEGQIGRRSGGLNMLDMYFKKLRRDVFEIIKDIRAIKRSMSTKQLPNDLELLMRGLNRYVRSQGKSYENTLSHLPKLRRYMTEPNQTKLKQMVLDILDVYDKGIGNQGVLNQLSQTTKGILQRMVKQNQMDDFVSFGVRISNPENIFSKDLKSIGTRWPEITDNFLNGSPSDKLYNLKLLHLMLTVDINKLMNIMKVLNFAQNRRVNMDTTYSEQEMTRVQNEITDLNKKLQKYFQKESEKNEVVTSDKLEEHPKKSFLKQIKSLFKSSRKDVKKMLDKKVSKSEIVKELAKNKLGELAKKKMAQYEDTLRKWQTKLSVRAKRGAVDFKELKDRMKNILPSYLRGKLNPAIEHSKKKMTPRVKKQRQGYKNRRTTKMQLKTTTPTILPKIKTDAPTHKNK